MEYWRNFHKTDEIVFPVISHYRQFNCTGAADSARPVGGCMYRSLIDYEGRDRIDKNLFLTRLRYRHPMIF